MEHFHRDFQSQRAHNRRVTLTLALTLTLTLALNPNPNPNPSPKRGFAPAKHVADEWNAPNDDRNQHERWRHKVWGWAVALSNGRVRSVVVQE